MKSRARSIMNFRFVEFFPQIVNVIPASGISPAENFRRRSSAFVDADQTVPERRSRDVRDRAF